MKSANLYSIRSSAQMLSALAALLPLSAFAGPTASQGSLLMGFRVTNAPGNGTSVVVNIGQASTFRDATSTITIANINTDLENTYGSGWNTRTDLQWGVGGCPSRSATFSGDVVDTIYMSRVQSAPGVSGTLTNYNISTSGQRGVIAGNLTDLLGLPTTGAGFDDSTAGVNPLVGLEADAFPNCWRVFMGPGGATTKAGATGNSDFGWDSTGVEAAANKTLSLLRWAGTATPTYRGYFKIETNGNVTFTPATAAVTYLSWATANAGGDAANLDSDHDGVANGVEWFTGSSVNPSVVSGSITWPRAAGNATATSVKIQTSTDLSSWADVVTGLQTGSGSISYTLPTGQPKIFARLVVTP